MKLLLCIMAGLLVSACASKTVVVRDCSKIGHANYYVCEMD